MGGFTSKSRRKAGASEASGGGSGAPGASEASGGGSGAPEPPPEASEAPASAPALSHTEVSDTEVDELLELERKLSLREEQIEDREAELELWAERLRDQDGGANDPRNDRDELDEAGSDREAEDGGNRASARSQEAALRRRSSLSLSPLRRGRQSPFLHLVGGQGVLAEPYGKVGSVPAAEVPSVLKKMQKTLEGSFAESRALRVFVCSSLHGADSHSMLTSEVYTRLSNDASRRGVGLSFVDLHDELAATSQLGLDSFDFQLHAIDLVSFSCVHANSYRSL